MIHLTYTDIRTDYGILTIHVVGSGLFYPSDICQLKLPDNVNTRKGIVISGRAPIWLYAHLTSLCSTCVWVATYDPRIGGVVVQSCDTSDTPKVVGEIVDVPAELVYKAANEYRAPILNDSTEMYWSSKKIVALVGDPQSGKTVLLHALHRSLREYLGLEAYRRDVFTVRASPDGDGEWMTEVPIEDAMLVRFKGVWDDEFADSIVEQIETSGISKPLVLVDCGGKIDKRNQRILNTCTHAIIVARTDNMESVDRWKGALDCCDVRAVSVWKTSATHSEPGDRHTSFQDIPLCCISHVTRESAASVRIPESCLRNLLTP